MWTGQSDFAVSDSGFSGETLFSQFVPGSILGDGVFGAVHESGGSTPAAPEQSSDIDPDGWYLVRRTLAFVWPYDEQGRLIGEHVYEDSASKVVTKVDPSEVITAARAAELLAPLLETHLP